MTPRPSPRREKPKKDLEDVQEAAQPPQLPAQLPAPPVPTKISSYLSDADRQGRVSKSFWADSYRKTPLLGSAVKLNRPGRRRQQQLETVVLGLVSAAALVVVYCLTTTRRLRI